MQLQALPLNDIQPSVSAAPEDEVLYLLGRPLMTEDLGFLSTQVILRETPDLGKLADSWRAANDAVNRLQVDEAGFADNPTLGELHPDMFDGRDRLLRNESFRQTMNLVPFDLRMVELDRLIVSQKRVNLTNVWSIQKQLNASCDPKSVFDACMPIERPRELLRCARTGNDSFVFAAPTHDLRIVDVKLFDPADVNTAGMRGIVGGVVGVLVGYSWNCLTAFHINNRIVLINGTHRALALRKMGFTHAPCVVQRISRPEECQLLGAKELQRNPAEILGIPRPAVLKDFLDPRLHVPVRMMRQTRQVKVTVGLETLDAPSVDSGFGRGGNGS
jgi:hypothetical protein